MLDTREVLKECLQCEKDGKCKAKKSYQLKQANLICQISAALCASSGPLRIPMYVKIVGREVPFPLVVRSTPPEPCLVSIGRSWTSRIGGRFWHQVQDWFPLSISPTHLFSKHATVFLRFLTEFCLRIRKTHDCSFKR